jgi:hypothetical protein
MNSSTQGVAILNAPVSHFSKEGYHFINHLLQDLGWGYFRVYQGHDTRIFADS